MRINRILCACLVALLLAACCAGALAKVPSPSKEFYYLDQANVLSEATEGEIYFSNQLLYDACGAQIVVVTVDSTGSEPIDDYTNELFNSWGIGSKEAQNGFLLVLAIKDDNYYALCGDNLQPKFTASALNVYFDKYLEKDFAAKRYDAGVKKFFEAVFSRIADTYNADVTVAQGIAAYQDWAGQADSAPMSARSGDGEMPARESDDGGNYGLIVLFAIVLILIVVLVNVSRRRRFRRTVFYDAAPPPPPPPAAGPGGYRGVNDAAGPGGYRGVNNAPGAGGYRGPAPTPTTTRTNDGSEWLMRGLLHGMLRSGGGFHPSGGSSRSSRSSGGGGFRSSGGSHSSGGSRSFGGGHGGGGHSSGGGAGRGRH